MSKYLFGFMLVFGIDVYGKAISCETNSPEVKRSFLFNLNPFTVKQTYLVPSLNEKTFIYADASISCGESVDFVKECSVGNPFEKDGVFSLTFSCKAGQHGEVYLENSSVHFQCWTADGSIKQVIMNGCKILE